MLHRIVTTQVGLLVILLGAEIVGGRSARTASTDTLHVKPNTPEPTIAIEPVRTLQGPETTETAILLVASTPTAVSHPTAQSVINGVPVSRIVRVTDAVKEHIREIYAKGQALGRNSRSFSKVGDSTMAYPPFLAAFDGKSYKLGKYVYLEQTIDRFSGSFVRSSAAVRKGMHTWSEFDPAWDSSDACHAGEGPLACELRLNRPSVAIIRLGANDTFSPRLFEAQLSRIVEACLASGVVPVLGTKPDRHEGPQNTINKLIVKIASAYSIPLWDYDLVAGTVPERGLVADQVHIRGGGSHDYASPAAFAAGDSLEDLTALIVLDTVRREMMPP